MRGVKRRHCFDQSKGAIFDTLIPSYEHSGRLGRSMLKIGGVVHVAKVILA